VGWPAEELSAHDTCDGYLTDVVASEFEGALAADALLGVFREGGEAIDLFEDTQVKARCVDILEAAEGFVVLGEDSDSLTAQGILRTPGTPPRCGPGPADGSR
jgi:hypothetical protein